MKCILLMLLLVVMPVVNAETVVINGIRKLDSWNGSVMIPEDKLNTSDPNMFHYKCVRDDASNWLFYKNNDSLALSKTIFDSVDCKSDSIGFEIRTTKSGIAAKSIANGTGRRYIPIPNPVVDIGKRFQFDNKLIVTIDNGTSQWQANPTSYWFSKVSGQVRANFNTTYFSGLTVSDVIIIKSDSYQINGSTSPAWQNTTFDNTTLTGDDTNFIVIGNFADYFNRTNNTNLGSSWNESSTLSLIQNQKLRLSWGATNGVSEINYNSTINQTISFIYNDINTAISDTRLYVVFYCSNVSIIDCNGYQIGLRDQLSASPILRYNNGTSIDSAVSGGTLLFFNDSTIIRIEINLTSANIYYDNTYRGALDFESPRTYNSGFFGFRNYVGNAVDIYLDNYRLSTTVDGNTTHWYDLGAGRQGANVMFNFTNTTGLFVDGYASTDNFSTSNVLVASNISNATWVSIPASAKNQTQYVRAVLKGNNISTPELIEVSIEDEAVSGDGAVSNLTRSYVQPARQYRRDNQ